MAIARKAPTPAAAAPAAKVAPAAVKAPAAAVAKAAPTPAAVQPSASKPVVGEQRIQISKTLLENGNIKGEPVVAEEVEVRLFSTSTATTAFGMKMRKNIGNYESVEVSVFASFPCYVEDFDNTNGQVIAKVNETFNEVMSELDVSAFREEVVGAADFGGGDAGGEGVAEVEGAEGAAEDGGDLTADWFDGANRDEIVAFLDANPVEGLDPADYPEDEDLRTMCKQSFFPDEEEAAAEGADDAQAPYTSEELNSSSMEDLKTLWQSWEMGNFPAFTAKTQATVKKSIITKILAKQSEATGG